MIVKNRDKQAMRKTAMQSKKHRHNRRPLYDGLDYNPARCKTIQWILCVFMSVVLCTMAYYLSAPRSAYVSQYSEHIPQYVSISPNTNNDQWEHSEHQLVTHLSIVLNKRLEFERGLKQIWDHKMQKGGLFAYPVHELPTKLVHPSPSANNPYNLGFELLFSAHRIEKLQHKDTAPVHPFVDAKWDDNAFNFYTIRGDNILSIVNDTFMDLNDVNHVSNDVFSCYVKSKEHDWNHKHLLVLNKYPIGEYSGLFIPFIGTPSTQLLTQETLERGIHFANMFGSEDMRIGFNSMGAMASVNHLHFQFWSVQSMSQRHKLPIEILSERLDAEQSALYKDDELIIREMVGYPIHGFIYQRNMEHNPYVNALNIGLNTPIISAALFHCIDYMINHNIPHNLLINRHKIFVFVRKEETPSKYPIFYGFTDVAGWITLLNEEVYNSITVEELWNDMKSQISIDDTNWLPVKQYCASWHNSAR
eukprot:488783_1